MQHELGIDRPCPGSHRDEKAPGHAVFARPGDKWIGRGRRTCLGCRLGRFAAERHWRSLTPRHALRGAQPCLVAKTFRPVTKNSATAKAVALFLAGAEGLEPSARGFGVDVGTHQRERRRGGVARSPRSSPQRAVLIWCYEESEVEKACRAISFSSPTTISFCLHRATGVGNEITTC